MTVLIACMHYIAVCKPLRAAKICTKRNAWIAMVAGLVLNIAIHSPLFFALDVNQGRLEYNDLFTSTSFTLGYLAIFQLTLVRGLLPLSVLIFDPIQLQKVLQKSPNSQETATEAEREDARCVTTVVMAFCLLYIVANMPVWIISTLQVFEVIDTASVLHFMLIFGVFPALNSTVKAVIYYLLWPTFSKEMKCSLHRPCYRETYQPLIESNWQADPIRLDLKCNSDFIFKFKLFKAIGKILRYLLSYFNCQLFNLIVLKVQVQFNCT